MSRAQFEDAVSEALDGVPADLARMMDNVVVLVEDDAPDDDPELLGLYEGTPLTERDGWWASGSLPDRITIFMNPTLALCDSVEDVVEEVRVTVDRKSTRLNSSHANISYAVFCLKKKTYTDRA